MASVIVTGTAEQVDAAAARHGLAVKKRLGAGAVVEVSAKQLAELATDNGLDLITGNQRVTSHMAVTNEAPSARPAWVCAGAASAGPKGGRSSAGQAYRPRRRHSAIDSGIADVPNLRSNAWPRCATSPMAWPRGGQLGHGTHVAGIIAASRLGRDGVSGVAPGAHLMT